MGKMAQVARVALKAKMVKAVKAEVAKIVKGEIVDVVKGFVFEVDGEFVEVAVIVKKDGFDLADAKMELADKVRKADERVKAKADKLAKVAKAKAEKAKG